MHDDVSDAHVTQMDGRMKSMSLVNPSIRLKSTQPSHTFKVACNMMHQSGRDGYVVISADVHGFVVARKMRLVSDTKCRTLSGEKNLWNAVHNVESDGVPAACLATIDSAQWMLMPYLRTLRKSEFESLDLPASTVLGCGGLVSSGSKTLRELMFEEIDRVAELGVENGDARPANFGFHIHGGRLKAAMIDFADAKRFSKTPGLIAAAKVSMRAYFAANIPLRERQSERDKRETAAAAATPSSAAAASSPAGVVAAGPRSRRRGQGRRGAAAAAAVV